MLAGTYNASSMLQSDYGPLEQVGSLDSPVFRGRGHDGSFVTLRFWRGESDQVRRTLLDMAYAASSIRHPMLCAVGGCQSFGGSLLCIVSEFVPGVRLDRWLSETGLPNMRMALDFVRRLCLGVHTIHLRGLTHSALNPSNLIVLHPDTQPGGRIVAKLLDVGVPALLHAWPPQPEAASYLAPELLSGVLAPESPGASIHPSMNVYSCGCLLHYICTGQAPFSGETLPELMKNVSAGLRVSPRELNPEIDESLAQLIVRTLSLDPSARPASAAELAGAIGEIEARCKDSGIRTRVVTPTSEPSRESVPPARASFPELAALTSSGLRKTGAVDVVHPRAETLLRSGSYARVSAPASKPKRTLWLGTGAIAVALLALWLISDSSHEAKRQLAQRPPVRAPLAAARSVESAWRASAAQQTPHVPTTANTPAPSDPPPPSAADESPPPDVVDAVDAVEANEPAHGRASPEPAAPPVSKPATDNAQHKPAEPARPPSKPESVVPAAKPRPAPAVVSPIPDLKPEPSLAPPPIRVISLPNSTPAPVEPRVISFEPATHEAPAQRAAPSPHKPAELQIAAVNVRGSLTVSIIRRAIERVRPLLNQCFEPMLATGRAVAPLQVSTEIDEVGRLRNPSVSGGVPELNACVLKATTKMVAEAPDTGIARASWTLRI